MIVALPLVALSLTTWEASALVLCMTAKVSSDGKIQIPQELRDDAQLKPGDTLQVSFYKGTIVLRKHLPLTQEQCAELLEQSRHQSKPMRDDDAAVEQAIREVRARRR